MAAVAAALLGLKFSVALVVQFSSWQKRCLRAGTWLYETVWKLTSVKYFYAGQDEAGAFPPGAAGFRLQPQFASETCTQQSTVLATMRARA